MKKKKKGYLKTAENPGDNEEDFEEPKTSEQNNHTKFYIFLAIIFLVIYFYLFRALFIPYFNIFANNLDQLLLLNPVIGSVYLHIKTQMVELTYLGIFYLFFVLSLFFIPAPNEVIFAGYLLKPFSPALLALVASVAITLGHLVDYLFGRIVGEKIVGRFSKKEKLEKFEGWIKNHGTLILILVNILPLPSEFFSLIYGFSKYPVKKFIILTLISNVIKFVLIILLFNYSLSLFASLFAYL